MAAPRCLEPSVGDPGRVDAQPKDYDHDWKWKWESDTDPPPSDPRHPISRAVQLRKNLDYGERLLPPPRSRLQENDSASQAESFIISRPWFLYSLECNEFSRRKDRIPWQQRGRPHPGGGNQVTIWWKERGDWQEDWEVPGKDRGHPVAEWKWRHESPSPEPEDLSRLLTDGMDFTPSEIDALEANRRPTPPPPRFPQPSDPECHGPYIFGNVDLLDFGACNPPQPDIGVEDAPLVQLIEPEDQNMQAAQAEPAEPLNPPPRRRCHPRKQSQPARVASAPAPPLRRSARIAARTANQPSAPAVVTTGRRASTRPARPVPAAPPPGITHSIAEAPKRGRPRKTQDGGISKPAAPPSKRGRKSNSKTASVAKKAAAAALDGKETNGDSAAGKRRRGRPRRTQ
jgi:hypothetical protein